MEKSKAIEAFRKSFEDKLRVDDFTKFRYEVERMDKVIDYHKFMEWCLNIYKLYYISVEDPVETVYTSFTLFD